MNRAKLLRSFLVSEPDFVFCQSSLERINVLFSDRLRLPSGPFVEREKPSWLATCVALGYAGREFEHVTYPLLARIVQSASFAVHELTRMSYLDKLAGLAFLQPLLKRGEFEKYPVHNDLNELAKECAIKEGFSSFEELACSDLTSIISSTNDQEQVHKVVSGLVFGFGPRLHSSTLKLAQTLVKQHQAITPQNQVALLQDLLDPWLLFMAEQVQIDEETAFAILTMLTELYESKGVFLYDKHPSTCMTVAAYAFLF